MICVSVGTCFSFLVCFHRSITIRVLQSNMLRSDNLGEICEQMPICNSVHVRSVQRVGAGLHLDGQWCMPGQYKSPKRECEIVWTLPVLVLQCLAIPSSKPRDKVSSCSGSLPFIRTRSFTVRTRRWLHQPLLVAGGGALQRSLDDKIERLSESDRRLSETEAECERLQQDLKDLETKLRREQARPTLPPWSRPAGCSDADEGGTSPWILRRAWIKCSPDYDSSISTRLHEFCSTTSVHGPRSHLDRVARCVPGMVVPQYACIGSNTNTAFHGMESSLVMHVGTVWCS